jgi:hypothetical protein
VVELDSGRRHRRCRHVRSRGEVGERRGGDFNVNRDFFLSVVVSNELLPPRSLRGGRAAGH